MPDARAKTAGEDDGGDFFRRNAHVKSSNRQIVKSSNRQIVNRCNDSTM
jgi:hypothetical protein